VPDSTELERSWAQAFTAGDAGAFDALYRSYAPLVHDFLRWTVRDPSAAEDLTQSTFLRAWEQRSSLRDPGAFRSWLFRIAHNLAMNEVTRRTPAEPLDDEIPMATAEPGPEEALGQSEASALVWDAAASLEPRQFAVLDLSVRKGLATGELAAVLGVDNAAASVLANRAREALANAVRYLLVARSRSRCERLAELVPEGVRRLTPEQRATVDHHMRRCEICRDRAVALTAPEALFGAAPLVALPRALQAPPRIAPQPSAVSPLAAASHSPFAWIGAVALVAIVGTSAALLVRGTSGGGAARSPAASGTSSLAAAPAAALATIARAGFHEATVPALPPDAIFRGAACPTSQECLAVGGGSGGVVARTIDGGATWTTSVLASISGLDAIACPSPQACVAAGRTGSDGHAAFFSTADAGATWQPASAPADASASVIRCPDAQHCLAVGERVSTGAATPSVLQSTDGGRTWKAGAIPVDRGAIGFLGGLKCTDAAHCWVVGSGIWFTDDLGLSWQDRTPVAAPCPPGQIICGEAGHFLTDVWFSSAGEGWVVGGISGGGYGVTELPAWLAHTTDGGATWHEVPWATYGKQPWIASITCAGSACVTVSQTFTRSSLDLSSDDGASWTVAQAFDRQVFALACSPDLAVCLAAGGGKGAAPLLAVARRPG
jgi:RNA polymerase sigma factor (sigma-70 family)